MALEGTLRDFSFADILQLISLQRKTGVLTLKSDDNVVTISFLNGRLVGASSLNQHTEDRLGLILLKRGVVTETELEAALRRQEETLQRLGRILIDHHVVDPDRVREALEQQILQIVYRVFRWADGEYHFSQETDVDYDRDLMVPMVADSIIMEGARMTDEWPFVDQRIPSREMVFIKVDSSRMLEVVEVPDTDFDDLGFSFTDVPEESPVTAVGEDRVTPNQAMVYELVNGQDSVTEVILRSPLIEFETCKALAELVDSDLIREASPEEVAHELSRQYEPERQPSWGWAAVPWLALPFLILFGFSVTVMQRNPLNPSFGLGRLVMDRYVLEGVSWYRMERLGQSAESRYYLDGIYPADLSDIAEPTADTPSSTLDPWGRPYRMATRGSKLLVTGSDSSGQPVPLLLLSRPLAWEGLPEKIETSEEVGVVFIE